MSSRFSNSKPGYPFATLIDKYSRYVEYYIFDYYIFNLLMPEIDESIERFLSQPENKYYPKEQLEIQHLFANRLKDKLNRSDLDLEIGKLLRKKCNELELITWEEFQDFLVMQKLAE